MMAGSRGAQNEPKEQAVRIFAKATQTSKSQTVVSGPLRTPQV